MQIIVRDNNVDQALRALEEAAARGRLPRDEASAAITRSRAEKRARERAAAIRRARKLERKRAERDGVR